ncbi:MAG: ZIP family zinc transporter [Acidobacteria bacterium]|nr:ZIP family zinc transporter [Acidobacteriota bacterium]
MEFPHWLVAGFWGFVAGLALLLGAAAGYLGRLPQRFIAAVMAFGSGVLVSALTFELMDGAYRLAGLPASGAGFLAGAVVFTAANWALARRGAKHRKRSGDQQPSEKDHGGSGMAIAVGTLLDGIPESVVIGTSLLAGARVSLITVLAVFVSNIPEGLSSAAGMRKAGRSAGFVFGLWTGMAAAMGLAALLGYLALGDAPPAVLAATTAVAAGAILAMLADTMIPEAFESTHDFAGLITVLGFLMAFGLSKWAG